MDIYRREKATSHMAIYNFPTLLTSNSEQIVNSVLDELGVTLGEGLSSVPTGKVAGQGQGESTQSADADLAVCLGIESIMMPTCYIKYVFSSTVWVLS